jgi:hypothetical protein
MVRAMFSILNLVVVSQAQHSGMEFVGGTSYSCIHIKI